jgi:hypothetical protein
MRLFKNKKTRQTYRVGKARMHFAGDQKLLTDSVKLTETQKGKQEANQQPK